MVSSVEMVLWAIHHATTLLFGVFASAALCGIEINRRHALELVGVGVATGAAFSIANAVGGELSTRALKPACLAYLDITCQYEKHAGLLAFPFASSLAKVYFFKVNHRHAPRKNEVAGLLRAGAFGLGRRKVM